VISLIRISSDITILNFRYRQAASANKLIRPSVMVVFTGQSWTGHGAPSTNTGALFEYMIGGLHLEGRP